MSDFRDDLRKLAKRGKKFDLITADPPWSYNDKANDGNRGASHKYKGGTLSMEELVDAGPLIQAVANKNCVLLMWGTWPLSTETKILMKAWGFKYRTCAFVWVKFKKVARSIFKGMGHYTRSNTEFVYLGVRKGGKSIPVIDKGVSQLLFSHLRENSRKPDEYFEAVDRLFGTKIKRLEIFGRNKRKHWTVLGDETGKFEAAS